MLMRYADNGEIGDVDKTPLTPQERQQFAKWLIDSANDYAQALDGVEESAMIQVTSRTKQNFFQKSKNT